LFLPPFFRPDGRRLVTASGNGTYVWELPPDNREPHALRDIAQLLASHRVDDATGSLVSLERSTLRELWERQLLSQRRQEAGLEGAVWAITETGLREAGIRALSGADGVAEFAVRDGARCLTLKPGASPKSLYLYFDVDDRRTYHVVGPLYVAVEYFDETPANVLTLQYDSASGEDLGARYREAEQQVGAEMLGSKTWKTAIFLLAQPRWANRQNLGADFRLTDSRLPGTSLFIRSVRVTSARPATAGHSSPSHSARPSGRRGGRVDGRSPEEAANR
jgi:hypothetical protein